MADSKEKYLEILQKLLLIRTTEETIAERYKEQKMRCPTHLCTGQEAIAAGICTALAVADFVVSTHRAHGHYLAKGGDLNAMIAEIYGKATGCSAGKGGSMHLVDTAVNFMGSTAIVGGTIPVGVGLALSAQLKKTNQISCTFFGDGSTEEGVFYESVNFAVVRKLPVLFVCEDNLYSVYSPKKVRQPDFTTINDKVKGLGCEEETLDGNNAIEIYNRAGEIIKSIRENPRPYFLRLPTYRWREHCGPNFDNDIGYRSIEEYEKWKERDPVKIIKQYMLDEGRINRTDLSKLENSIQDKVNAAFDFAEHSPFPGKKEMETHIYA